MADDDVFYMTTRLTVTEFLILFKEIGLNILQTRNDTSDPTDLAHASRYSHRALPACDELLLWFYHSDGNCDDIIAHQFHIHPRSVARIADHVTAAINNIWEKETMWPDAETRKKTYGLFSVNEKAICPYGRHSLPSIRPVELYRRK